MTEQGYIFIAGIVVAVLSYFAKNFILIPFIEYKGVVGKIRNRLKYYANVFGNDVKEHLQKEATEEVRQLSCDLEEAYYSIGYYKFLANINVIPKEEALESAAKNLIGLSNSTGMRQDFVRLDKQQEEVKVKLKMKGIKGR